jgi:predicted enzyme related to lactoylglutathione lyase
VTTLTINVDVDDLRRAIDFYTRAFGLTVARTLFGATIAELRGGPCPIFLLEKPAGGRAAEALAAKRDYTPHWTPVHLDFIVDALDPALARAVAAGAVHEGPVTTHVWGRLALLRDPFGHGVCLIEWNPAGYDDVTDR